MGIDSEESLGEGEGEAMMGGGDRTSAMLVYVCMLHQIPSPGMRCGVVWWAELSMRQMSRARKAARITHQQNSILHVPSARDVRVCVSCAGLMIIESDCAEPRAYTSVYF